MGLDEDMYMGMIHLHTGWTPLHTMTCFIDKEVHDPPNVVLPIMTTSYSTALHHSHTYLQNDSQLKMQSTYTQVGIRVLMMVAI